MAISSDNLHALSSFASVAGEYCAFIDSLRSARPSNLYSKLEELLPRLHSAIMPVEKEIAARKHRKFDKLGMTGDQWGDLAGVLRGVVAKESEALFDLHGGRMPDADEVDKYIATCAEMIWDHLAEIYRELRDGLALWELATPDSQAEAAWDWRFGYELHWGHHLFHAMIAVHEVRYQLCAE